jgi:hypothetical protein
MAKQLHEGAIQGGKIRDMLIHEFRLDHESAESLIRKWFPNLTGDRRYCANCGASMVEEIYSLNCLDAVLIIKMGEAVRERVRKNIPFTEANQVHVPTLATTDAIRHRTTKCAKLGLVAKVIGSDGKQVKGRWLITARGWAFLRGEPVPKRVAVWRGRIQERFNETTTIDQALKTRAEVVQRSRDLDRIENKDIRNIATEYRREDWFEFGKTREGALL